MGQPVSNEKLASGRSVSGTEEPVTRSYLLAAIHTLPVDVESDAFNTMHDVQPESCLQRYWREDGFLDESRARDKTVTDVSAVSNHVHDVVMHPATEPLPKYCPRGNRFSRRLARQRTIASDTALARMARTEGGQPPGHGEHLPRKHLKNIKTDKKLSVLGNINVPRKRDRPCKQLEVEVPSAELCGTCYDRVATLLDRDLNSNILPLRVGTGPPAEDKGVAKRGRGRPRTLAESQLVAFKRKDPIAGH